MSASRQGGGGFAYVGLLVAIVLIGAALAAVGQVWAVHAQREREVELLYRGDAIRRAIRAYVMNGARFPLELQDLVDDQRSPKPRRFLRRIYADPMTDEADWTLIRAADGGIMGVASTSKRTPLKRKGFSLQDVSFEDADCYCDWQFIYVPRGWRSTNPPATPTNPPPKSPTVTPQRPPGPVPRRS